MVALNETTNLSDYLAAGGDQHEIENQRIRDRLVQREIVCCVSSMVGYFDNQSARDGAIDDPIDVTELMSSDDWETPGREYIDGMDRYDLLNYLAECGIEADDTGTLLRLRVANMVDQDGVWQDFCQEFDVDPYQNEAYEHWAVTGYFQTRLSGHGEITGELFDFKIWGRCCTGQSISMDSVIAEIAAEMQILKGQKNEWSDN